MDTVKKCVPAFSKVWDNDKNMDTYGNKMDTYSPVPNNRGVGLNKSEVRHVT